MSPEANPQPTSDSSGIQRQGIPAGHLMGHAEIHGPAPDVATGFDQRIAVHPAEHSLLGISPAAARFRGKHAKFIPIALRIHQKERLASEALIVGATQPGMPGVNYVGGRVDSCELLPI